MSERETIIRLLQDDIRGEHAAIIQYLQHVWRMEGIGDIPPEIEEIAREEMRHFRWLCELVVDLGGDPTMERDPVFVDGAPPPGLVRLDIEAEDRAIEQYAAHIVEIDDRRVNRLLRRIIADERAHREKFRGFIIELGGDPDLPSEAPDIGPWTKRQPTEADGFQRVGQEVPPRPAESTGPFSGGEPEAELMSVEAPAGDEAARPPEERRLLRLLDEDVMREYTTILQYLRHAFLHKATTAGFDVQIDIAQWHMKHMGWLAELMSDKGQPPSSRHAPLDTLTGYSESLRYDLATQRALANHYAGRIQQVEDAEARAEYARIQLHQEYQVGQFEDLLEGSEVANTEASEPDSAPAPSNMRPRPTIGNLFGRAQ